MSGRCAGILLGLLLGACATTANYEKGLSAWTGKSETELLGAWGPPSAVKAEGGRKFLTYVKIEQYHAPGTPPMFQPTVIGNTVFVQQTEGSPGTTYNARCTTIFELAGGRIVSSRWDGNGCVSQ